MSFFKNLFACYNNNDEESKNNERIKQDVIRIKRDVQLLFDMRASMSGDLKRLEDKLQSHFSILMSKIDNVIMMLNSH